MPDVKSIREIWTEQRDRLKGSENLHLFTQRLTREWAIETGIIENLYEIDRGVTQTLIERGFQAALIEHGSTNKPREYVIQILKDQQDALEGLFDFVSQRRTLTTSYIKEMHAVLLRSQGDVDAVVDNGNLLRVELIRGTWKTMPNYPSRDGVTYLYCPPEQVASEMDRLVEMHNEHVSRGVPPEVEASWLHHRFTVIHPFQDGNGRVARAMASLVLIQQGLFPLVVTRDDKVSYLDALEIADLGELDALVQLLGKLQRVQFRRATFISETILYEKSGVDQAMAGLRSAITLKENEKQDRFKKVFSHCQKLESLTFKRLEELSVALESAFRQLDPHSRAIVDRSDENTDYYFRGQIVEVAKYLGYYADTNAYRSWVRLKLTWSRRVQFVFTFHSVGVRFAGVLAIAPFLEFIDDEDNNDKKVTLAKLSEEPFEIYYNEEIKQTKKRFQDWIDIVLTMAVAEIQQNL